MTKFSWYSQTYFLHHGCDYITKTHIWWLFTPLFEQKIIVHTSPSPLLKSTLIPYLVTALVFVLALFMTACDASSALRLSIWGNYAGYAPIIYGVTYLRSSRVEAKIRSSKPSKPSLRWFWVFRSLCLVVAPINTFFSLLSFLDGE